MLNTNPNKSKQEALQILSYGKSVPTRVGIISLVGCSMAFISLLIQFLNYGAIRGLSKKQVPSLVQLSSGETIRAKSVESTERSPEVIKKFVSDTFMKMFNWDGLIQASNKKGEPVTKQDTGVEVKNKNSSARVTTIAYEMAFALSENEDFRAAFLRKLSTMTPSGIFNGDAQVSLIPRFVSQPRKLKEGKWQVDLIATLVTFERTNNAGNGIPFNKTITVESITNPTSIEETTELAKKIYAVRQAGLEITQIVDYKGN